MRHELSPLVSMEDFGSCSRLLDGLFDGGQNELGIVVLPNLDSNHLSCDDVLYGSQIPKPPLKFDEADVRAPELIGLGRHPFFDEVVVSVMTR